MISGIRRQATLRISESCSTRLESGSRGAAIAAVGEIAGMSVSCRPVLRGSVWWLRKGGGGLAAVLGGQRMQRVARAGGQQRVGERALDEVRHASRDAQQAREIDAGRV